MVIRQLTIADALGFGLLLEQLDRESQFMLFEPGERPVSEEQQRQLIGKMQEHQVVFVAEQDSKLIGFVGSTAGTTRRAHRTANLVVGVLRDAQGRGVGSALLHRLEDWAREKRLHRLELTVMTQNEHALRLYRRHGFVLEGKRRQALFVDGEFVDEHYMAKLLDEHGVTHE